MVRNADKFDLLTSTPEQVGDKIENEIIKNSSQGKLLRLMNKEKAIFFVFMQIYASYCN